MHHVHGFDSNGDGNITRERDCAKTGTWAVLIKRLKKAMCAFAWRNPCDVDFSVRLTEVTPTRVRKRSNFGLYFWLDAVSQQLHRYAWKIQP